MYQIEEARAERERVDARFQNQYEASECRFQSRFEAFDRRFEASERRFEAFQRETLRLTEQHATLAAVVEADTHR